MTYNEKECIEYALHAYDTFWDYYKKTLDERNQILNNYMIFVGIPISVVGFISDKIINNIKNYTYWLILALTIILALGIILYAAYIVESFISERYLEQIKQITDYLIQHYDNKYKNVFSKTYNLDKIYLDKSESQKHRIRKSFIIIIINTSIMIGIFYLFFNGNIKLYYIMGPVVVSFLIHFTIFTYHQQKK